MFSASLLFYRHYAYFLGFSSLLTPIQSNYANIGLKGFNVLFFLSTVKSLAYFFIKKTLILDKIPYRTIWSEFCADPYQL